MIFCNLKYNFLSKKYRNFQSKHVGKLSLVSCKFLFKKRMFFMEKNYIASGNKL